MNCEKIAAGIEGSHCEVGGGRWIGQAECQACPKKTWRHGVKYAAIVLKLDSVSFCLQRTINTWNWAS